MTSSMDDKVMNYFCYVLSLVLVLSFWHLTNGQSVGVDQNTSFLSAYTSFPQEETGGTSGSDVTSPIRDVTSPLSDVTSPLSDVNKELTSTVGNHQDRITVSPGSEYGNESVPVTTIQNPPVHTTQAENHFRQTSQSLLLESGENGTTAANSGSAYRSNHPGLLLSGKGKSHEEDAEITSFSDCNMSTSTWGTENSLQMTKVSSNVTSDTSDYSTICNTTITVPNGNYIHAFFESLEMEPIGDCRIDFIFYRPGTDFRHSALYLRDVDDAWRRIFYRFPEQTIYIDATAQSCSAFNVRFRYRAVPVSDFLSLTVVHKSPNSGYVTTPGYDDKKEYPPKMNTTLRLNVTADQVILVSFPHFGVENHTACRYDSLTLSVLSNSVVYEEWKKCGLHDIASRVFHSTISLSFLSDSSLQLSGFKMMFTILPKSQEPQMLENDLFNCSVPHFEAFAHHVKCNLAVNCVGREDEVDCFYTSQECGPGSIDAGEKCYTYTRLKEGLSWYDAYSECKELEQTLVSPKSPQEWAVFKQLMQHGCTTSTVYTGLRTSQSVAAEVPALYRDMWQWSDHTMGLHVHVVAISLSIPKCTRYSLATSADNLLSVSCVQPSHAHYVCERFKPSANVTQNPVLLPSLPANYTWSRNITVLPCPSGHVVRDFLSCDLQSQCRGEQYGSSTSCKMQDAEAIPLFLCDHSTQSIHYTLVCDFRLDCSDGSDESFCVNTRCPEDQCRTGQCITRQQRCDGMQHCTDASDENCPQVIGLVDPVSIFPPAVVRFGGKGSYTVQPMNQSDPCPQTHFRCGNDDYCMPLYVRCNGMDDCPNSEDEADCDHYTCPGFFRCRGSTVCLHPDHVCDGVFQCPQQDDELLCDMNCPDACHCQGLAFVCPNPFPADSFPSLRFLDLSGSGMTPDQLTDNVHLVHLRLSRCSLGTLPAMTFENLQTLDVSDNLLSSITMDSFILLENLKVLILSGNPLMTINPAMSRSLHVNLNMIDFSWTRLETLNSSVLANFPGIRELNFSSTALSSITEEGFGSTPDLEVLDLKGCQLLHYPSHMLTDLSSLRLVFVDDFKMCCKATLPDNFDLENCHSPSDDIASCEDLLRFDVYRVFLWIFALLAVFGNVGSFIARFYLKSESFQSSFNVLVTNLSVADFLMGVYLTVIGVADQVYRGQYLWYVDTWKESVACQVAGFLSLMSSEVSAFFICLITLDRFLVLRFPFSKLHFKRKSALVASGIAWVIGFLLAVIPLLPMTSHWQFYSQTGICIPLPFTDKSTFRGHSYSFGVMIVLNLAQFLLIAVGQFFIYSAVRANRSVGQPKKKSSRDAAIARRLTTIVASDFLCWFPIGLLGVLASTGTYIPQDVNVGVAIFVLPFNSALNPFLYTFNIIMEKRSKASEARMLQRLESRYVTELSRVPDVRLSPQMTVTKETALNQIEGWLGVRVITMGDLATRFDMMPKMNHTESASLSTISDVL